MNHGKNSRVILNGTNISNYCKSYAIDRSRDVVDVSTFSLSAKKYIEGLADVTSTLEGVISDNGDAGIQGVLKDIAATTANLCIYPNLMTQGQPGYGIRCNRTARNTQSSIDDSVKFSYGAQGNGGAERILSICDEEVINSGNLESEQLDVDDDNYDLIVYLNVTSFTVAPDTLKLYTNSGGTELGSFTVPSAISSERATFSAKDIVDNVSIVATGASTNITIQAGIKYTAT